MRLGNKLPKANYARKGEYTSIMDSLKDVASGHKLARKRDPKLHSAAHLLADELSQQMNDRAHFGLYLKMAVTYPPDLLRKIAGEILENPKVQNRGRLFSYLIKKHNEAAKAVKNEPTSK